jgi:hypothetical protein
MGAKCGSSRLSKEPVLHFAWLWIRKWQSVNLLPTPVHRLFSRAGEGRANLQADFRANPSAWRRPTLKLGGADSISAAPLQVFRTSREFGDAFRPAVFTARRRTCA